MAMKSSSDNSKKFFRKLSNREKTIAVVVLAALLVGAWLPGKIIVSTSPSLNHRVFFMTPVQTRKIKIGDYLVFRHRETDLVHKGLNPDNDRLIKEVGCSPGDLLKRDADGQFSCNAKLLGKSLAEDS